MENKPLITVITPTTGDPNLIHNLKSVQNQTYEQVEHYVVVDGPEYRSPVNQMIESLDASKTIHVLELPFNVGHHGWNGHRVYASIPHLVDGRYVVYLDEDNLMTPDHVSSLVKLILKYDLAWAYSLRNIIDSEGTFICQDNCESLGTMHPVWNDSSFQQHMCDTNTYMIDRKIAMEIAPVWTINSCQCHPSDCDDVYHKKGRDRQIYHKLMSLNLSSGGTKKYTINYRVDSSKKTSVQPSFFRDGNDFMKQVYGILPWHQKK